MLRPQLEWLSTCLLIIFGLIDLTNNIIWFVGIIFKPSKEEQLYEKGFNFCTLKLEMKLLELLIRTRRNIQNGYIPNKYLVSSKQRIINTKSQITIQTW